VAAAEAAAAEAAEKQRRREEKEERRRQKEDKYIQFNFCQQLNLRDRADAVFVLVVDPQNKR
jgi:hypothetical protein